MTQNSSTNPATGGSTTIAASASDDQLSGGGGNDTINGLAGNDRLSGDAPLPGQWTYSVYDRNFSSADNQTSLIGDAQSTLIGRGYVDDFDVLALRNTVNNPTTSPTQNRDDFGVIYQSGLSIATAGTYTFGTRSDDGSRIIIKNSAGAVVFNLNNDFHQSAFYREASVTLPVGQYTIEVLFWENLGETAMSGTIAGPGIPAGSDLATSSLITLPPLALGHVDGDDSILGDLGNDTITGGGGNDRLFGGADQDSILGEAGNDVIDGGTGDDYLSGGADNDSIVGNDGADSIDGGTGNDSLFGGIGADSIFGNDGDDSIDGGADGDTLLGGAGNDSVFGNDGADSIDGGIGNDVLTGGIGSDRLFGNEGDDRIDGGGDNDTLDGGNGADTLQGGAGADSIFGNEGNDSLDGGTGDDWVSGGLGNDTVYSDSIGSGTDSIFGGEGADSLMFGDGDDTVFGGGGSDLIDDRDGVNLIGTNLLYGGGGNDRVWAGFGDDSIFGDAGNDLLHGEQGDDSIYGGAGVDTMYGDEGNPIGNDRFIYAAGDVEIVGGSVGVGPVESIFGGGSDPSNDLIDFDVVDLTGIVGQFGWKRVIIQSPPGSEDGRIEILASPGGQVIATIYFDDIEDIIKCFTPGTMILTDRGEVPVEDLAVGDLVVTHDNGLQPLRWVGRQHLSRARLMAQPELQPVRIACGAFAGAGPDRSMLVSPQHRLLVTGARAELLFGETEVLVPALYLVGRADATRALPQEGVTYIHILFDQHEIVRSDGIWSESFQLAERTLSAMETAVRDEILAIFPGLSADATAFDGSRPTLKAHEARVLFAR